jgi:UDP-glucose 4-epimerase
MHVLLTGASSFLGRHLAEHLLLAGLSVTATYRTRNVAIEHLSSFVEGDALNLVQLDLADYRGFSRLPPTIDVVMHVAGASILPGISTEEMLACNVTGTSNVVRYALAAGARRMIYASTLSVHGKIDVPVVDEHTPIVEPDVYGASKYLGERLLAAVAGRLASVAVRLPGVLGRGAHRAWLPSLVERIRAGRSVVIFNPDAAFNNAAHIDDLVRFFGGLTDLNWQGFHAFPVAAAGTTTIRQIVDQVISAIGKEINVTIQPVGQPSFTVLSDCAIHSFGYQPTEISVMIDRYIKESLGDVSP